MPARRRIETRLGSIEGDLLPRPRARSVRSPDSKRFSLHPFYGWETPSGSARLAADQRFVEQAERGRIYTVEVLGGSVAGLFVEAETGGADVLEREGNVLLAHAIAAAFLDSLGPVPPNGPVVTDAAPGEFRDE